MKTGLPSMKNVLLALSKSVLVPLGLTAAASVTDATIQKSSWIGESFELSFADKNVHILK